MRGVILLVLSLLLFALICLNAYQANQMRAQIASMYTQHEAEALINQAYRAGKVQARDDCRRVRDEKEGA